MVFRHKDLARRDGSCLGDALLWPGCLSIALGQNHVLCLRRGTFAPEQTRWVGLQEF